MNKKGFTLIELTLVIALISILFGLVVPALTSIDKNTKKNLYKDKIELALGGAYKYGMENLDLLNSTCYQITIGELIELEYFDGDDEDKTNLINPHNNESMNDQIICLFYKNGKVETSLKD